MIALTVTNRLETQQLTHQSGPLEFGRGPRRGAVPRVLVQDGYVSRDHLRIEERPNGTVRVDNLSLRAPVAVDDALPLPPGSGREFPLPVRLGIGDTVIEAEEERSEEQERFLPVFAPPRGGADGRSPGTPADGPTAAEVVGWLEPVLRLNQAAGADDLYTQAAKALVDRVGLDTGAVLLHAGGVWKTVGYSARDARATTRPISHALLARVLGEKRTFYLPAAAIGQRESLVGVRSVLAAPLFDDAGEVIGVVGGTRSVYSRGREIGPLEGQVAELLASAVNAGRARGQTEAHRTALKPTANPAFLGTVANALRGPLTDVLAAADDVDRVRATVGRLLGLVDDLLDLTAVESGAVKPVREPFDLIALFRQVLTAVEPQARPTGNRLVLSVPADLGTVVGDPDRMRRCLLGLVADACEFVSNGTVTVSATRPSGPGAGWLRVQVVAAGGVGTPIELPRPDSPVVPKPVGGLGLAMSRKLAEAMGGSVRVENQTSDGATYTLVLPTSRV